MISSGLTTYTPAPGATGSSQLPGPPGVSGQSAYQVAVAAGFTGTVQQWLASLVGPAADTGALNAAVAQAQGAAQSAGNAAANAQAASAGLQNQKGAAFGVAPLDAAARLPPSSYAVHPGQVIDAASAAFQSIPRADLSGFLAQVTVFGSNDGLYTALFMYPVAPPNGRLWNMLFSYLTTSFPGLSPAAATGVLEAIWQGAASITP